MICGFRIRILGIVSNTFKRGNTCLSLKIRGRHWWCIVNRLRKPTKWIHPRIARRWTHSCSILIHSRSGHRWSKRWTPWWHCWTRTNHTQICLRWSVIEPLIGSIKPVIASVHKITHFTTQLTLHSRARKPTTSSTSYDIRGRMIHWSLIVSVAVVGDRLVTMFAELGTSLEVTCILDSASWSKVVTYWTVKGTLVCN